MTIHAGPYIRRRIDRYLELAEQCRVDLITRRRDADQLMRDRAEYERKAEELADGTDYYEEKKR